MLGVDTNSLPFPSPSRRSFAELPDLDLDADEQMAAIDTSNRSPSLQLLALPGAETDHDLIATGDIGSLDIEPSSTARTSSLGIYIPPDTGHTAPHETGPDLNFPPDARACVDGDEPAKLIAPPIVVAKKVCTIYGNYVNGDSHSFQWQMYYLV